MTGTPQKNGEKSNLYQHRPKKSIYLGVQKYSLLFPAIEIFNSRLKKSQHFGLKPYCWWLKSPVDMENLPLFTGFQKHPRWVKSPAQVSVCTNSAPAAPVLSDVTEHWDEDGERQHDVPRRDSLWNAGTLGPSWDWDFWRSRLENLVASTEHIWLQWHDGVESGHFCARLISVGLSAYLIHGGMKYFLHTR